VNAEVARERGDLVGTPRCGVRRERRVITLRGRRARRPYQNAGQFSLSKRGMLCMVETSKSDHGSPCPNDNYGPAGIDDPGYNEEVLPDPHKTVALR